MLDDLHRPLGLDIRRKTQAPRGIRLSWIAASCLLLVLVGGSAATALMQPKLREVDVFAEAEAHRKAALAAAPPAAPLAPVPPSPKVIAAPLPEPELPTVSYPPSMPGQAGQLITVRDPSSLRQPPQMAGALDDALIETSDLGPLPTRGFDGRRPFDVYSAEPASDLGTRVAIVVGGLGISQTGTQAAIRRLPRGVTLGFAPTGNSLDRWMQDARRSGHEIVLQAPMEPFGYPDVSPGQHTLVAADAEAGNFEELHWSLGRLTNYVGVMNYMGARVTADPGAMRPLLGELARRGLMFLDDGSSARSTAKDLAREAGVVFAGSDVLLDASQDPAAIARQLETLERVARADGSAIGIASAFDTSVAAIAEWIEKAEARGIRVVPVSALANDPEAR